MKSEKLIGLLLFLGGMSTAFIQYGYKAALLCFITTVGYFMININRLQN
jgi:hypothetical protein